MPEKKPAQKLKLADGKVRERARLTTLFSNDSYADMSSLNHIDIVGPVSNCQSSRILTIFPYKAY